jgi:hypothetical protein
VKTTDFKVSDAGSVWLFEPTTVRARRWLVCSVEVENWPWFGPALAVEPPCAPALIKAMTDHGLRIDGEIGVDPRERRTSG